VKVDPDLLPHFPNLYWLGGRDYSVLPNYCRAFDICMMPFAINAATEYINPTKVLEYLATGRPVVSTPVRDVVHQYSDLVDIVRTDEEFINTADRLLRNPDRDRIQRGIDRARQCGWESTVNQMQNLIKEAIGKSDRRSARRITPLDQTELEYVFQATQGS
jgi:glycosyltransferase involved in cell wall biosynthesis